MTEINDEMREKAYQLAHPDVDWTRNEVLWAWSAEAHDYIPDGHWSFEQRDEAYRAMAEYVPNLRKDADGNWKIG